MFEFHGWASVRSNLYEIDDEADAKLLAALREQIEHSKVTGAVAHLAVGLNGDLHSLLVAGFHNHRSQTVFDLFRWLAHNGPGSYGLLYVHDDEDHRRGGDYQNDFRVWRLARGRLEERADPFLSPCIPSVEDPYDPDRDE